MKCTLTYSAVELSLVKQPQLTDAATTSKSRNSCCISRATSEAAYYPKYAEHAHTEAEHVTASHEVNPSFSNFHALIFLQHLKKYSSDVISVGDKGTLEERKWSKLMQRRPTYLDF